MVKQPAMQIDDTWFIRIVRSKLASFLSLFAFRNQDVK